VGSKLGVLYDYLQVKGGAEQVALSMAGHYPDSELVISSINANNFDLSSSELVNTRALQRFSTISPLRVLKAINVFKHSNAYINQYDQLIYSGFYAPLAIQQRTLGNNIYYCHTPPRYLYDLKNYYEEKLGIVGSLLLQRFSEWYRPQYEDAIGQMDIVLANSKNVQNRLKRYLNIDSIVINPPVNIDQFRFLGQSDYYISLARLEPYKQVDKIIEAFKLMPDKKLLITSGGSDYHRLKKLANSANNITFTGWLQNTELAELLGNSIASIYIAKDEDFGMSPVESQASGKPVIGMADGGLLETVKHEETGLLINKNLVINDIIEAVDWMTPSKALGLKNRCINNAKQFGADIFFKKMGKVYTPPPFYEGYDRQ